MRNFLVLFLLCPLLAACMGILEPKPELDLISRGFTESMRWSDFPAAAGYVDRDARDEFLVQFTEDEDLHIVDSTILSMDSLQEDQATLVYVLEYYRLPSGKINKWRWEQ
ncbi:MAG: hypothetical protein KAU22_08405, partial [Desulfuromonadales bacterium]|nr:hypothetical protein [Desulfuromonadales bacterium]